MTGEPIVWVIATVLVIWLVASLAGYKERQRKNKVAQDIHDGL